MNAGQGAACRVAGHVTVGRARLFLVELWSCHGRQSASGVSGGVGGHVTADGAPGGHVTVDSAPGVVCVVRRAAVSNIIVRIVV